MRFGGCSGWLTIRQNLDCWNFCISSRNIWNHRWYYSVEQCTIPRRLEEDLLTHFLFSHEQSRILQSLSSIQMYINEVAILETTTVGKLYRMFSDRVYLLTTPQLQILINDNFTSDCFSPKKLVLSSNTQLTVRYIFEIWRFCYEQQRNDWNCHK